MRALSLRIAIGIMSILGICFCVCFCFYPTHADTPSNSLQDQTMTDETTTNTEIITDPKPIVPDQATPALDRETEITDNIHPQPSDKNDASIQTSSPGTEQNATATKNELIEISHESPENLPESNEGLTPLSPIPLEEPTADTTSQLIKRVEGINDMVSITFDDGPYPQLTEQYLEVLDKLNVRATFFMVGSRIKVYPELARQVVEQGNEIGSHSWQHARLDKLTADAIIEDLNNVKNQIQADTGQEVKLLRPPYGACSDTLLATAKQLGYQIVTWDVDPRDWEDPAPEKTAAGILENVKPGSIIILHEGHPNTLQALPVIIQKLRERGLEPVPVSVMLNQNITQMEDSVKDSMETGSDSTTE